jgi:hypothetical protein
LEALVRAAWQLGHLADPVQHGAAHTVVREGLKLNPSARVEAVSRLEQPPEAKRDQIVEIAPQRELAAKPIGEAVNHSLVARDELRSLHARS